MIIGVGLTVLLILIGALAAFFIFRKRCCQSKEGNNTKQEMTPLRATGRPLSLDQFRQRSSTCHPTMDEFEKLEKDARARNISKSTVTAMEFVRSKIPLNR